MPMPAVPSLRFISASTSKQHRMKSDRGIVNADVVEEAPACLGICDGVSEVHQLGIAPDEFPRELLQHAREALEERDAKVMNERRDRSWPSAGPGEKSWLVDVILDAYSQTEAEGSTTFLMAVIEENNRLMVAQLGDCTLLVLRRTPSQPQKLQIAFQTEPLRFEHNKPFQIVRLPGVPEDEIINVIGSTRVDYFQAQHGDLIVLGTDGIFDNLHNEDVVRIVEQTCPYNPPRANFSRQMQQQMPTQALAPVPSVERLGKAADAIVAEALDCVCSAELDVATGSMKWPANARQTPSGLGGKPDDTTVIVATVVQVTDTAAHEEYFNSVHPSRRGWFGTNCCGGTSNDNALDRCRCS